jgi:hypothetical protein
MAFGLGLDMRCYFICSCLGNEYAGWSHIYE